MKQTKQQRQEQRIRRRREKVRKRWLRGLWGAQGALDLLWIAVFLTRKSLAGKMASTDFVQLLQSDFLKADALASRYQHTAVWLWIVGVAAGILLVAAWVYTVQSKQKS